MKFGAIEIRRISLLPLLIVLTIVAFWVRNEVLRFTNNKVFDIADQIIMEASER